MTLAIAVGAAPGAAHPAQEAVPAFAADSGQPQSDAARDGVDLRVAGHGSPPDARLPATIEEVQQRPAAVETVESLLATPWPTPDEAQAFIGDWVGHIWMGDGPPTEDARTLRIRVENDRVVAELISPSAPPELRTRRVDYLKVTPAGLTWGNLNGMQPRAVVLFEGALDGDVLKGQSRWGGLDLRTVGGTPPLLHFAFKRVQKAPARLPIPQHDE